MTVREAARLLSGLPERWQDAQLEGQIIPDRGPFGYGNPTTGIHLNRDGYAGRLVEWAGPQSYGLDVTVDGEITDKHAMRKLFAKRFDRGAEFRATMKRMGGVAAKRKGKLKGK